MYVIAGTAYWQVDETVYEQHQNELFWTVPGQPHMTANREHQAYHKLWLGVRTVDLDRACLLVAGDLLTLSARKRHIIPDAREMEAVIRGLILQVIWQKPGCAQVCRSYLHTFLSLVAQSIAEGCSSSKTRDMRPFCPPVHNAIAFMRDNLHRHVKLEEIAAAAHLSASQLSFHFHRSVGMSPASHHLQMRLEAARDALLQPEISITQVAMNYGFSSSQHFSMDFHRAFGITPLAWRRGGLVGSEVRAHRQLSLPASESSTGTFAGIGSRDR